MELISVIVPVYKVEKYLNKCVESIVNQTYKNLEIILVDDGSPDNCPKMCDEWAEKDARIKVVHKPNGGLSDARNAGMAVATGEYIAFVDSDDWINEKYIELLYNAVKDNNTKMSACDVEFVYDEDYNCITCEVPDIKLYSAEDALAALIQGKEVRAVAWNKLYHKNLLQDECFKVGKLHEDEFFTYKIIDKCDCVAYVDCRLYYYVQRSNSIMTTASIKHLDSLEAGLERLGLFEKKYHNLYKKDKITFCKACVLFYKNTNGLNKLDKKIYKKRIKQYRRNVKFTLGEIFNQGLRDMVFIVGSKMCIGLTAALLKGN